MVYTDYIHIIADSLAELHSFAEAVGIKRCWFDANPKHPHYDVPQKLKTAILQAVRDKECLHKTTRELILIIDNQRLRKRLVQLMNTPRRPQVLYLTPEANKQFKEALKEIYGNRREVIK